ncbi:MAG: hypothetical protein ACRELE_12045 [Gemmatimonadales bacterium]
MRCGLASALGLAALGVVPRPAAPGPRPVAVSGRVVRIVGRDTVAIADVRVVLHRVTVQQPGPIDSTRCDRQGGFGFRVVPDTGAIYLVSARWSGIEYFGTPLALTPNSPPPAVTLVVADTSSQAPVHLAARHLIVSPITTDGVRDVVDLMVLENRGPLTRVSPDSAQATWRVRLPHFAVNVHGGNSGFSLQSLVLAGDTIALYAAIPPGSHDVEIDYQIPPYSRRFAVPVDEDVPVSNIISADLGMVVHGAFTRADTTIDKTRYARWQGSMAADQPVLLQFGRSGVPGWLLPAMVGVMAVVLVAVTLRATRSSANRLH